MTRQRDDKTLDLLAWEPPAVAEGFRDQRRVRAASLSQRIARSISETLRECDQDRAGVCAGMSEYLGEEISENMLNAYASPAREDHRISLERTIALLHVTADPRLLGDLLAPHGFAVIPEKYLGAIEDAMCDDVIDRIAQRRKLARRKWRGKP